MRQFQIVLAILILITATFTPTVRSQSNPPPSTQPTTQPATPLAPSADDLQRLGVTLADTNDLPDMAGITAEMGGNLVVQAVAPDSRAQNLGIQTGDVIKQINGQPMQTIADIIKAAQETGPLKIEIIREGKPKTLDEAPDK